MESHEILEYIRAQLAAGQTESVLRQHMIASGWSEQAVGDVFTQYHISTMSVARPIPIAPEPRKWLRWIVAAVVLLAVGTLLVVFAIRALKPVTSHPKQATTTSVLQQNADDTARKNDISRIVAAVAEYASNNTGALPQQVAVGSTPSTLLLCGASCTTTTVASTLLAYYKPAHVSVQPYEAGLAVAYDQDVYIVAGVSCAADGKGIGFPDSPRSFVVLYSSTSKSGLDQHCVSS